MRSRSLPLCLVALSLLALSCKGTEPDTHLSGHVIVAGPNSPPGPIPVLLYTSDPFSKGSAPVMITPATGSGSELSFEFPTSISHGDYYVVAWLDVGLDGQMDTGDYVGWYNGDTTAAGARVASLVHKNQGDNVAITIEASISR